MLLADEAQAFQGVAFSWHSYSRPCDGVDVFVLFKLAG
ncbi:hypothetical protein YSA_01987 [Pseudomonas putida ND6]|uniref:Uncharacterized protein n=1 Tax=Pseudomonas putida ND6 TaxID=231023 RepID=I3UQS3_PSEPU|nr:hypothetical protein YSA_01987 [Pseudomonas putida ND6]